MSVIPESFTLGSFFSGMLEPANSMLGFFYPIAIFIIALFVGAMIIPFIISLFTRIAEYFGIYLGKDEDYG